MIFFREKNYLNEKKNIEHILKIVQSFFSDKIKLPLIR